MKHLVRRLVLFCPLAVAVIVAACGGDEEVDTSSEPSATTPAAVVTGTPEPTPEPTLSPECAALPTATGPAATPPEVQVKTYPAKPEMTIDPSKTYIAHVYLEDGKHIIMNLLPEIAPEHVNSFVFLATDNFFDGLSFHRVVKSPEPFVAQTGDPTGTGSGGPGYSLPLEASQTPFERGAVGAARSQDPNSAGSQWFITLGTASHLNGQYTVFAQVVAGMEYADCIEQGDRIVEITIDEL